MSEADHSDKGFSRYVGGIRRSGWEKLEAGKDPAEGELDSKPFIP